MEPNRTDTNEDQQEKDICRKREYLVRTFSRTTGKRYENYVLHAIWQKLNRNDIQPVTQQYVKRSDGRYSLMDLYFPQLDIAVECDEKHHPEQAEEDWIREIAIKDALAAHDNTADFQLYRIQAYEPFKSIEKQIDDTVSKIKEKIKNMEDAKNLIAWDIDREPYVVAVDKHKLCDTDRLAFEKIIYACKCFGKNYKRMQKCYFSIGHGYYIWFPKLAVRGADGEYIPGPKGWINVLSEDEWENFTETNEDSSKKREEKDIKPAFPRITFAKSKNELGEDAYRFIGVYEYDKDRSDAQNTKVVYKRIAKHIDLTPWLKESENK